MVNQGTGTRSFSSLSQFRLSKLLLRWRVNLPIVHMGGRQLVLQTLLATSVALICVLPLLAQRDTIRTGIDLVVVPVSVREASGRFVYGLEEKDFSIFEDGRPQQVAQFSIDPSPLSAVVLVDTGVGGKALRRFASSIIALSFAFTDVDEVAVYRFDSTVGKISDFTHDKEVLEQNLAAIQRLAEGRGEGPPTPPVILPGKGPRWLRWLLDRGIPTRVLNDAVFAAVVDLGNRRPETRKIVIIIPDGQATGAIHSLQQTRDQLIQGQVQAYGVTLGLGILGSAFSILHTYANASGGDVYSGRTQQDLETALSDITEQARHQYVLGYVSNNEVSGLLPVSRKIEVETARTGTKVQHRTEYLQYPPRR